MLEHLLAITGQVFRVQDGQLDAVFAEHVQQRSRN
jgi:hypothetical protein